MATNEVRTVATKIPKLAEISDFPVSFFEDESSKCNKDKERNGQNKPE